MLFVKVHLVFGIIKKIISVVASAIFKVLCWFHLELTLLCVTTGFILEVAYGVISKSKTSLVIFHAVFALTVLYALLRTLGVGKKREKTKKGKVKNAEVTPPEPPAQETVTDFKVEIPVEEKPKYYRVKQNPKYVMAEYADRYELFLDTDNGYEYVRTDYKGERYGKNL